MKMTNLNKIKCNQCPMFFLSTDDLLEIRLARHEEWHLKCTYFGSSNLLVKRKVEWITTQS